jgi:hypothetical protein
MSGSTSPQIYSPQIRAPTIKSTSVFDEKHHKIGPNIKPYHQPLLPFDFPSVNWESQKEVGADDIADCRKRVVPFLLSTFFHFSQKFLYQERHVRYKPTLYRPGTKRNGKSGKEKTPGRHVSCNPL